MILGFTISFLILQIPNETFFNLSIILVLCSFLFSLIFGIISLIKKEFIKGTIQTLSTLILGGIFFGYFSFFLMFYPYDFFANNLKIPNNIMFEKPIGVNENENDNQKTFIVNKANLILYDGMQPGIYQYEIYLDKIEKGSIYLKIYEITSNKILSENDIYKRSKIEVYNPTNELTKFKLKDDFTIYEGDWGQYYGSRIEVWFKSENRNIKDRKLFSKNYIIQGWQR